MPCAGGLRDPDAVQTAASHGSFTQLLQGKLLTHAAQHAEYRAIGGRRLGNALQRWQMPALRRCPLALNLSRLFCTAARAVSSKIGIATS